MTQYLDQIFAHADVRDKRAMERMIPKEPVAEQAYRTAVCAILGDVRLQRIAVTTANTAERTIRIT